MSNTLFLDYQLPTLNEYINIERTNRFKAASEKKKHTKNVYLFAKSCKLKLDHAAKYNVLINWHVHNLKSDPDNIAFGIKFILDGIVKAGVLSNDGHKQIGSITHTFTLDKSRKHTAAEIIFNPNV